MSTGSDEIPVIDLNTVETARDIVCASNTEQGRLVEDVGEALEVADRRANLGFGVWDSGSRFQGSVRNSGEDEDR